MKTGHFIISIGILFLFSCQFFSSATVATGSINPQVEYRIQLSESDFATVYSGTTDFPYYPYPWLITDRQKPNWKLNESIILFHFSTESLPADLYIDEVTLYCNLVNTFWNFSRTGNNIAMRVTVQMLDFPWDFEMNGHPLNYSNSVGAGILDDTFKYATLKMIYVNYTSDPLVPCFRVYSYPWMPLSFNMVSYPYGYKDAFDLTEIFRSAYLNESPNARFGFALNPDVVDFSTVYTYYNEVDYDENNPPYLLIKAHSIRSRVILSYYNAFTGLGISPYAFNISSSFDGIKFSRITPIETYGFVDKNLTIRVSDFFGREIYIQTRTIDHSDYYWDIPLPVYSYKFYNQQDYFTKIWIWYDGIGGGHPPYSEYLEPRGIAEFYLMPGVYTFGMTLYYNNGITGNTYWWNRTVNDAGFVILNGTTITEVMTTAVGIKATQEAITNLLTPDLVVQYATLPTAPSGYAIYSNQVSASILADLTRTYQVLTATRNQYDSGKKLEFYQPYETIIGATTEILSDRLSFTGSYNTAIYINTTTGANIFNSTYLPSQYALSGQNITIWANNNISASRTTTFKQMKQITWTYLADQKKYSLTNTLYNNLSADLSNVVLSLYYPVRENIDQASVKVYDNENGVYLTLGTHYDQTYSGVHFSWPTFDAHSRKSLTITAYSKNDSSAIEAIALISTYIESSSTSFCGAGYYIGTGHWANPSSFTYSGNIVFRLDFENAHRIIPSSIMIYDVNNRRVLNSEEWYYSGGVVVITAKAVGTVLPGSSEDYLIAFKFDNVLTYNIGLTRPLFSIFGFGISMMTFILVILPIGTWLFLNNTKFGRSLPQKERFYFILSAFFIALIVFILSAIGVID